LNNTLSK
jgi:hypothetical protein